MRDILVVGAGPVGLTLAAELARHGIRCRIIDRLAAGDRAPDAAELKRHGVGFSSRLFDILRGTEHVLLVHLAQDNPVEELSELSAWAMQLKGRLGSRVRVVAVTTGSVPDWPDVALYADQAGAFGKAYGARSACFLVRPDGYIGWRGRSWTSEALRLFLSRVFHGG